MSVGAIVLHLHFDLWLSKEVQRFSSLLLLYRCLLRPLLTYQSTDVLLVPELVLK